MKWTEGGEDRAEVTLLCAQPLNSRGFLVVCIATFYFYLRMNMLVLLLIHAYTGTRKGRVDQGACDLLHALVLKCVSAASAIVRCPIFCPQVQLQKHTRQRLERAGM